MKTSKLLLAAFALFAFAATANTASAQVSSTVNATGTVLEPISFTSVTNLDFGTSIFPGLDKSVAYSATGAASFDIDGETSKVVSLSFTLPTELTETGGATMPITFSTTDAAHNTSDATTGATSFDPNTTGYTTALGGTSGLLYVWLGGTVSPADNQVAGAYTGSITLDVAYTGN